MKEQIYDASVKPLGFRTMYFTSSFNTNDVAFEYISARVLVSNN